ncbi:LysR substrate-binding domain-containing protein [Rhodoligotrophos ferricapiens]|uniref:LysR substrate-binding domain-containing protein n=1 Tax=Rhodoligotrophos ferricapiens TaxID=3069264 RepID=UPI00315D1096
MSRRHLPPMTALRAFEAVGRTLSFTRAADELGVTQAAVSRQIKSLEQELSVTLVMRGARNRLTDAGEILFAGLYRAFETIESSVDRITGSGSRDILNVSVAPFFSAHWLTPRLMAFYRQHPGIDLRLHHSYHPADHKREGIEIGINWGAGNWAGVGKEKVLDGSLTAVMSPGLARQLAPLTHPGQLMSQMLLYEFDIAHWKMWCEAAGIALQGNADSLRLNDSHALRRAALDGHGVALFFTALVQEDLAAKRLVQPFPVSIHVGYDYYLNHPEDLELTAKAKIFRRWILAEACG